MWCILPSPTSPRNSSSRQAVLNLMSRHSSQPTVSIEGFCKSPEFYAKTSKAGTPVFLLLRFSTIDLPKVEYGTQMDGTLSTNRAPSFCTHSNRTPKLRRLDRRIQQEEMAMDFVSDLSVDSIDCSRSFKPANVPEVSSIVRLFAIASLCQNPNLIFSGRCQMGQIGPSGTFQRITA